MTYTGDTDYVSSVVDAARGVDLLLSEAAFSKKSAERVEGVHLTGKRAGTAAEAGASDLVADADRSRGPACRQRRGCASCL